MKATKPILALTTVITLLACIANYAYAGSLDGYKAFKIPNYLALHENPQAGDYAIIEGGKRLNTLEVMDKQGELFIARSVQTASGRKGAVGYEYHVKADGTVARGYIFSTSDPNERVEVEVAGEKDAVYIAFVDDINTLQKTTLKAIDKHTKRTAEGGYEMTTSLGTFPVEVKGYYIEYYDPIKPRIMYRTTYIYFLNKGVNFGIVAQLGISGKIKRGKYRPDKKNVLSINIEQGTK
jgi:hypothetical protein